MSAGEIRAGKAFVEVYTKDGTAKGLDGIKSKFGAFAGQIAKIGGLSIASATAAVSAAVMKAVSTGANIQDLADRYALGTTAIQQLSFAAKMSGASLETLIIGIRNMQKGLGNGTLSDDLNQIGLSAAKLSGLSPEKQFEMIAEAVGGISDPAQRTAIAMKIFGKSGADLIPLLKAGEGGVKALNAEFDKMGVTMSEEAVKQAAALDDELVKLSVQWDAMVVTIGSKVIPAVLWLISELSRIRDAAPANWISGAGTLVPLAPEHIAPGTGNSPLGQFIASLAPRLAAAKAADGEMRLSESLDQMQSLLYSVGIGRRQMRPENIAAIPGNIVNGFADYLMGSAREKMKSDVASFGTFDKRDIAGGAYLQATNLQLAELKKIERDLDEIKRKKPGVPWG